MPWNPAAAPRMSGLTQPSLSQAKAANTPMAISPASTPRGTERDPTQNPFFSSSSLASAFNTTRTSTPRTTNPISEMDRFAHSPPPPAHDNPEPDKTITAEGVKAPSQPIVRRRPGLRGLPSEMPSASTSGTSTPQTGGAVPGGVTLPIHAGLGNANAVGGAAGGAGARPGIGDRKQSKAARPGFGPGGRLPSELNTLPHTGLDTIMSNFQPSPPAAATDTKPQRPGVSTKTSGGTSPTTTTGALPSVPPTATSPTTTFPPTLGRTASRSSSRRRSSSYAQGSSPLLATAGSAGAGGGSSAASVTGGGEVPFHLTHNPQGNIGLQNALQAIKSDCKEVVWVGALGNRTDAITEPLRSEIEDRLWSEQRSVAVWLEDEAFVGHYDVFCKQILWPTFHYSTVRKEETTNWEDYVAVNQAFADRLIETYQEGDIIFVNDYHLLLVPQMVRARLPKSIIGFFLHIAFPSSEIFRCLALREELLHGVLGADLVGFQTYNFARHFRQTVSRVLQNVEATPKGILTAQGSTVDVEVFGIGIDVETLEIRREEPEVEEWAKLLRERYGDTKLIVARDKLDEVKGLKHKLLSFELFLQNHPEWQGKVVLIQVALSTTEINEAQENVSEIVTRINSKYSSLTYMPVVFLHTEPPTFSQYLGLMTVADAFIATSLREGMNLTAHEFVKCQSKKHRPVILSEFTGSYSYSSFRSCLPVNPWDYRQVAEAIHTALTMSDEEATTRWRDLDAHVTDHTAQAWAKKYLTHLERAHLDQLRRLPGEIPLLDLTVLEPDYRRAGKRLLLLDLEGTLYNEDPAKIHREGFHSPEALLDLLRRVSAQEHTTVYLLSGRGKADLDKIASAVPRIGLVAEHGCFIKPAGSLAHSWISTIANIDMSWRSSCLEILAYFTERTPTSFIEDRGASIAWRFSSETASRPHSDADETPDHAWAKRQAAEAQNHVSDVLCERYKLQIYPGRDAFLVLPRQTTRSHAVASILSSGLPEEGGESTMVPATSLPPSLATSYDFVVCLSNDERLIAHLNALKALPNAHTITSGRKHSQARWACESGKAMEVLKGLVEA